jgi:ketosteroid isomerase-like protein
MSEEEAVLTATRRFYGAIEDLMVGKGIASMKEAWHQLPNVTAAHPFGDWAVGWEQVYATWEVFEHVGRPEMNGSEITSLRAMVFGDVAYAMCVFIAGPFAGAVRLNCTNVLRRIDGVWKIVHHHADQSPALGAAVEKMMANG